MNVLEINLAKEKYDSFRKELEEKISKKEISIYNKECYLIKKSWFDEFIIGFNNYNEKNINSIREHSKINSSFSLPKNNPEILNDTSSLIEFL